MSDYTRTPNLGLYKPIYDQDYAQWGAHLNLNSDMLDGVLNTGTGGMFLPLNGGQMLGPLLTTATGGSVARAEQDRAADVANVLDFGADPAGVIDSTPAFRAALATGRNVWAPRGTYRITGQLTIDATQRAQALQGAGASTVLLIDTSFDSTVTTGVIVVVSGTHSEYPPTIADLTIKFVQPTDLITHATAASAAGTNTITVNSTAGIIVGMSVVDATNRGAIPSPAYLTAAAAPTVTAIAGNVVTISRNVAGSGVAVGDSIQFGPIRSMWRTIAAGATTTPGGTGVKYPWAIYSTLAQTLLLRNLMIINAWDGIYIRGSAFRIDGVDVGAFDIALDIDQCYNFPQINGFRSWMWGYFADGSSGGDAVSAVYYDGATVAANFGETDGLAANNFQSWTGIVNLTSTWTWGTFTNLMMDGSNANLNILSTGNGFVEIANFYSTKGATTQGNPLLVNAAAGFYAELTNVSLGNASGTYNGILVQSGNLSINNGYLWHGQQAALPLIQLSGTGVLYLSDMQLDASGARTDTYIGMAGTAALHMQDCTFVAAAGSGGVGVSGSTNNRVTVSNVLWNGWGLSAGVAANNQNNGQVFVAPGDGSSMQSGALSFATLAAGSQHFCTGFGQFTLALQSGASVNNTAFGSLAGYGVTSSSNNTFLGATSGYSPAGITGSNNTCLGAVTGYHLTSGANNTFIGSNAGNATTTGSGNIYLADGSVMGAPATESNTLRIGTSAGVVLRATAMNTAAPHLFFDWLPASASYANDAAASAGGVAVGQLYRNGSTVMVRMT